MNTITKKREICISVRIYPEDGGYVAHSPVLDIASQGDTVEEAKQNFVEALQVWMEAVSDSEFATRLPFAEWNEERVFETRILQPQLDTICQP